MKYPAVMQRQDKNTDAKSEAAPSEHQFRSRCTRDNQSTSGFRLLYRVQCNYVARLAAAFCEKCAQGQTDMGRNLR